MNLSSHFTLAELVDSRTARRHQIKNAPGPQETVALQALCVNLLEPLRALVGKPLVVTSGYRCPALNALVGGHRNSHHQTGCAADIHVIGMPNEALARAIEGSGLPYEELGREFFWQADPFHGWVHVSHVPGKNRRRKFKVP